MDVVLEVADTFLFDRLYAALLPAQSNGYAYDPLSTVAAGFKGYAEAQNNASSWTEGALNAAAGASQWIYTPATSMFSVQPSAAAWGSQWSRDNVYRQAVSLYLITW